MAHSEQLASSSAQPIPTLQQLQCGWRPMDLTSQKPRRAAFIEFSGTAGQVRDAFHAEIHQYNVNGETHYANAGDVKIPAAIAPLISGVSPMNDFRARPMLQVLGQGTYSRRSHTATPQWTLPNGSGTIYALAPEDFATQYDLEPLYKAGVNGAGQTIGIINESNIDLSLVQAIKSSSASPAGPTARHRWVRSGHIVRRSVEAYLDVEEAGAWLRERPSTCISPIQMVSSPALPPTRMSSIRLPGCLGARSTTPGERSQRQLWQLRRLHAAIRPRALVGTLGTGRGARANRAGFQRRQRFGRL